METEICCSKIPDYSASKRVKHTVADIFKQYGPQFLSTHTLTGKQKAVYNAVNHCRDGTFGFHVDICDTCGHMEKGNNSCRDRHCPTCNGISRKKWVDKRLKQLLPIPYYHTVFTLPHTLFPWSLFNARIIYTIFFQCAAETLKTFAADPRHLGAKIGFYGILHTWGGKLWQHLHIHFIVTGGGLDHSGNWKPLKYKGKYIFPVRAMSARFRKLFMEALLKAHKMGKLNFPDKFREMEDYSAFSQWLHHTFPKKVIVFAKPPFKGPEEVVKYIGGYSHKVAISNSRIKSIDNGDICFTFKNTRNNNKWEKTTLKADEFMRRFFMHVLPTKFHRIRHYGILANGKCKENVDEIRRQLGVDPVPDAEEETYFKQCTVCKKGHMITVLVFAFGARIEKLSYQLLIGKKRESWDTS